MSKKYRDLIATDKVTGEVLDRFPVYCPKKAHSFFSNVGFSIVSHSALEMLSESDLDGVTLKVLLRLISTMGMENLIAINQSELANMMGLRKSHFSRSMKVLVEREIILENQEKIGRSKTYRLNPNYAWRGNTTSHIEALENYEDNRVRSTEVSKVVEDDDLTVTVTVKRNKAVGNNTN